MKNRRFWLFLIVSIALFLRTYHLTELPPGLYPDEAMNGDNTMHALHTGAWSVFYPENNGREGLFINIRVSS
jgi:predicted membrane-bound mannosyltransferase